ncbi:hypothetical protein ABK040_007109 [Willaertia magna]
MFVSKSASVSASRIVFDEVLLDKIQSSRIINQYIKHHNVRSSFEEQQKRNSKSSRDSISSSDSDFVFLGEHQQYHSLLLKYFKTDLLFILQSICEDSSMFGDSNNGQFIQIELLLLDVDDFDKWKVVLPSFMHQQLSHPTILTTSTTTSSRQSIENLSVNSVYSVAPTNFDSLLSLIDITNWKDNTFSFIRYAVKIFGKVFCFMEDSLVYEIVKDDELDTPFTKYCHASKKFRIPLKKKDIPVLYAKALFDVILDFNIKKKFNLIKSNNLSFVLEVFRLFGTRIEKDFPPVIKNLDNFFNTYYYYRIKKEEFEDVKEDETKKNNNKYIDIDSLKEWERPIIEYTIPKDIFKVLKVEKTNWKSNVLLLLTYKQLINLLKIMMKYCNNFKEIYPFDYIIFKNFERKCWFDHYWQMYYDPISRFSHLCLNYNCDTDSAADSYFIEPKYLLTKSLQLKEHLDKINKYKETDFNLIRNKKDAKNETIKILCLDGGGLKGLNEITCCKIIEEKVGKKMCEIFDLICGTSTGGILTHLFQAGLSCDECREMYLSLGKKIFDLSVNNGGSASSNTNVTKTLLTIKGKAWYDEKQLEALFRNYVGDAELCELHHDNPLSFVLSSMNPFDENTKKNVLKIHQQLQFEGIDQEFYNDLLMQAETTPFLFRSYNCPFRADLEFKKKHPDFYLGTVNGNGIKRVHALRATSAAPLYFKEMIIGEREFVDGAVVANNPAVCSLFEARQIWPNHQNFLFVSLGTGLKKSQENISNVGSGNSMPELEEEEMYFVGDKKNLSKSKSGVFTTMKQPTGIIGNVKAALSGVSQILSLQLSSEKIHKQMATQVEIFKEGKQRVDYFRFNPPTLGDYDLDVVEDNVLKEWEEVSHKYMSTHEDIDKLCELLIKP